MEEQINLEISDNTLRSMIEQNPDLKDLSDSDMIQNINILEAIGCSKNQIINIISSNSLYLSKSKDEIIKLINYLKEKGFKTLNILFDSNPYIFNLEPFEIDRYIKKEQSSGKSIEDIIDELDSDTSLFFEI